MKKWICLLVVISMMCYISACGKEEHGDSNMAGITMAETEQSDYLSENESTEENTVDVKTEIPYDGIFPEHEPYGTGIGAMPGRVVWAHNPDSVSWDGSGYWWETDHFDEALILRMVNESIASLGGKDNAKDGWAALFTAHNGGNGYQTGEKIAIKANINGSAVFDDDTSGETYMSYTNPVLLKTLLISLVEEAGVSPEDITVYDVSRLFPDYMVKMCTEGNLQGVHFVGRDNGIADEDAPINWSYEFSGNVNYLPTCVTGADYVINLANLKGHSYGITLCGKNHFGSFINGNTMYPPQGANLHQWLTKNDMGIYSPLVDLMGNYQLGKKTVLYMLDALICAPSEGSSITGENSTWKQEPFGGDYTSSIFVSQDPVAIDSVGADFLINEPTLQKNNGTLRNNPNVENYLHEAGLVGEAPSGTVYYDGNGEQIVNLGVHEHWNNSTLKQYSRNLGEEEGIELVCLSPTGEIEISGGNMKIRVATDDYEVIFALNDTSAAASLYGQLPLTIDVENYSNNEKIFYPEKLDCTDVIEGACKAGTLAYFSPWDDVVMFYGPQSEYPGLYILGEAVEGADNIRNLSGKIEITKVDEE